MINIPHAITLIKVKHMQESWQDWGQNIFKYPLFQQSQNLSFQENV